MSELRRQSVIEIDHSKAPLCKAHTVKLHELFVSVDPAAAVNTDDHRQPAFFVLRAVHVENIPFMLTVTDIVKALYIFRRSKPLAALCVVYCVAFTKFT